MFTHIHFGDTCDLFYLRFFTRDSRLDYMNTPYDVSKTQLAPNSENFAGSQLVTSLVRVPQLLLVYTSFLPYIKGFSTHLPCDFWGRWRLWGGDFEGSELLTKLLLTNNKHCCVTWVSLYYVLLKSVHQQSDRFVGPCGQIVLAELRFLTRPHPSNIDCYRRARAQIKSGSGWVSHLLFSS